MPVRLEVNADVKFGRLIEGRWSQSHGLTMNIPYFVVQELDSGGNACNRNTKDFLDIVRRSTVGVSRLDDTWRSNGRLGALGERMLAKVPI